MGSKIQAIDLKNSPAFGILAVRARLLQEGLKVITRLRIHYALETHRKVLGSCLAAAVHERVGLKDEADAQEATIRAQIPRAPFTRVPRCSRDSPALD